MPTPTATTAADLVKLGKPELIKLVQALGAEVAGLRKKLEDEVAALKQEVASAKTVVTRVHAPSAAAPTFTPDQAASSYNEGVQRCAALVGRDSSLYAKFLALKR